MAVIADKIPQILQNILTTREDEIGCADCFALLDRFLELKLSGENAGEMMPLVEDHLKRCIDCHEEYEAVIKALRAME